MTLEQLAATLGCELHGDGTIEITAIRALEDAGPGHLTFLANPRYMTKLAATRASAVIVATAVPEVPLATLRTADPYVAFARALALFFEPRCQPAGIHPTAVIAPSAPASSMRSMPAGKR